jgi:hypothetical protein
MLRRKLFESIVTPAVVDLVSLGSRRCRSPGGALAV